MNKLSEIINNRKKDKTYSCQVSTKVSNYTHDQLWALARINNTTVSEIIRIAIENMVDDLI